MLSKTLILRSGTFVSLDIGYAGWYYLADWVEKSCTNFGQSRELTSMFQRVGTSRGQETRRATKGWRICRPEDGVGILRKPTVSQWHRDQNESIWFASSRGFPIPLSQVVRYVSFSATRKEQRNFRGFRDGDMQVGDSKEDLELYMKSKYNQENLKTNENQSEEEEFSDPIQHDDVEEDLLWKLRPNHEGKYDNVIAVLGDPQVLAAAHEKLNERRRNWTLATPELEVSHIPKENRSSNSREIDWNWFKEAAFQLRTGSYPFKPVKRLGIARRGRGEARHLSFVRPKDQVIQEAMRCILQRIFEPIFSVHDSGFRPNTNVHTALKSVKYGWKGISWFLQFDVRIADHGPVQKRLLKILGERIQDEVFLDILRQMFEVSTIWVHTATEEDQPEGSVLSPMLGHIYFHHLDLEINRIREEINSRSDTHLK